MGRIPATEEIATPNPGQQVGSYPQNFQTEQSPYMGSPWNGGLFGCHLDQTNALMEAAFPSIMFGQMAEVLDATDTEPSQEFRELKKRDLDPALGWDGILARQQAMQHGNEHINTAP